MTSKAVRITAALSSAALAVLLLSGCATASAERSPTPTASATPVFGSDKAVRQVMPEAPTDYDGAQAAWTATVAVWPLPVPDPHPFPDTIALGSLNEWDHYEATTAAMYANLWWLCAASTAVVDARTDRDTAAERYWLDALAWWGTSDTRSITIAGDGTKTPNRAAKTAAGEDCANLPGFTADATDTPATRAREAARDKAYQATIAIFPYQLPDGYAFPRNAPAGGMASNPTTGEGAAYQWWACATLESAWAAGSAGDTALADARRELTNQAAAAGAPGLTQWETTAVFRWDDRNARNGGDSGLCSAWFARLSGR